MARVRKEAARAGGEKSGGGASVGGGGEESVGGASVGGGGGVGVCPFTRASSITILQPRFK